MQYFELHKRLVGVSRNTKRAILTGFDVMALAFSLWAAFALRLSSFWPAEFLLPAWWLFIVIPLVGVLLFSLFGLYHAVLRFMELQVLSEVLKGVVILSIFLGAIAFFVSDPVIPRSVPIIFGFVAMSTVGGSRQVYRTYYKAIMRRILNKEKVAIYGAGGAGNQLAGALIGTQEYDVVAFFDDDRNLWKSKMLGVQVHSPANAGKVIRKYGITRVLLAMPSADAERKRAAIARMADHPVRVLSMPSMPDIVTGVVRVDDLQRVNVDDLLGRDIVPADPVLLNRTVRGKTVLVTGAGGSIGSELCRQILACSPQRLIIYDSSEANLYLIESELRGTAGETEIIALLGSVTNAARIDRLLTGFDVRTIYHAAACKHVPIVEENVCEGVATNVFGTKTVAEAAARTGVERFILISTDKAVRPTNIMGATKRCAELVVQDLATHRQGTIFSIVRFGNVLGSSGSVVPLFRKQIADGGPVTVTHPEVNRYFMTISEAAELVIQAGALSKSGDVFLLDMGTPIRIADLAKRMIHLAGKRVKSGPDGEGDIEIRFTGLRPGEKLFEELLIGDASTSTEHPRIMRAVEEKLSPPELSELLDALSAAIAAEIPARAKELLETHVSGYQSNGPLVDLLARDTAARPGLDTLPAASDRIH